MQTEPNLPTLMLNGVVLDPSQGGLTEDSTCAEVCFNNPFTFI